MRVMPGPRRWNGGRRMSSRSISRKTSSPLLATNTLAFLLALLASANTAVAICGDGGGGPASCTGDCDASSSVTVDEIVTMVTIALGDAEVSACDAGDADGNGAITVDEIITAVTSALNGCGGGGGL